MTKVCFYLIAILFIPVVNGCNEKKDMDTKGLNYASTKKEIEQNSIPKYIQGLKNLTVYPAHPVVPDTIILTKKHIFKSNKEVYFNGYVGPVAVDNQNRVYIAAGKAQAAQAVYVFKPDGQFITKIGRVGKGPGEILSISSIVIQNGQIFIYDSRQYKIAIFSLKNFEHSHDVIVRNDTVKQIKALSSLKPTAQFGVNPDGTFLLGFQSNNLYHPNRNRKILYYLISKKGEIKPDKILKLKKYRSFMPNKKQIARGIIPFPLLFSRSSLMAISTHGLIYTAWTQNFLIKVYSKNGTYRRAFYYPYNNSLFSIFHVKLVKSRRNLAEGSIESIGQQGQYVSGYCCTSCGSDGFSNANPC